MSRIIKINRTQFNEIEDLLDEYLTNISTRQYTDEFFRQLRLAKNLHELLPWYKRIFALTPSYKRMIKSFPEMKIIDRASVIRIKLNEMDNWEQTFIPEESDEFILDREDVDFINEFIRTILLVGNKS